MQIRVDVYIASTRRAVMEKTKDINTYLENFKNLEKVKRKLFENLEKVPEAQKPKLCREAVIENPDAIHSVPKIYRNDKVWLIAIKRKGELIKKVPEKYQKVEFYIKAVRENGEALEFVPENLKKEELCLAAVKKSPSVLESVPEKYQKVEFYIKAARENVNALNFVEPSTKRAFVKKAVESNKPLEEFCLEAVRENGMALQYMSEELRKDEIFCFEAFKNNPDALEFVLGNDLKNVLQNGKKLEDILYPAKTEKLCLVAVMRDGRALQYVPCVSEEYKGKLREGIEPKNFKTYEICLAAVKQTGDALIYVPEDLKEKVKSALEIEKNRNP